MKVNLYSTLPWSSNHL